MLQQFIQGLKENNLYLTNSLNRLPKSCSNSTLEVLDFDAVKEAYSRQIGGLNPSPKSCDALLINVEEKRLLFIEMKDLALVIEAFHEKHQLQEGQLHGSIRSQLNKELNALFLEEFRLDKKIIDSWLLLVEIADYCIPDLAFAPYLLHDCSVEFYIALGCTMRHYLRLQNFFLTQNRYYQYHKIDTVNFVPALGIEKSIQ